MKYLVKDFFRKCDQISFFGQCFIFAFKQTFTNKKPEIKNLKKTKKINVFADT